MQTQASRSDRTIRFVTRALFAASDAEATAVLKSVEMPSAGAGIYR